MHMLHRLRVFARSLLERSYWAHAPALGASSSTTLESQSSANPDIVVTGTNGLRFEPDSYTVSAGEQVRLVFSADGGVEHDFVVEDASDVGTAEPDSADGGEEGGTGANDRDLRVTEADPGQSTTATFQINEPGTYTVYCSVPGHREAGMIATLSVVDSP